MTPCILVILTMDACYVATDIENDTAIAYTFLAKNSKLKMPFSKFKTQSIKFKTQFVKSEARADNPIL